MKRPFIKKSQAIRVPDADAAGSCNETQKEHELADVTIDLMDSVCPPQPQIDEVRPGAVQVDGIHCTHHSLAATFMDEVDNNSSNEEKREEESSELVVPEAVLVADGAQNEEESRLFQDFLRFVGRGGVVVPAEPIKIETVADPDLRNDGDAADEKGSAAIVAAKCMCSIRDLSRRRIALAVTFVSLVVTAGVIVAVPVLLSRGSTASVALPPFHHTPSLAPKPTATILSTTAPASALGQHSPSSFNAFAAFLVNESVSNRQVLLDGYSPQFQALQWLSSADQIGSTFNAPNNATLYRYIFATVYYENGGYNWTAKVDFLSHRGICSWHNVLNDTGISCDPLQVKLGKIKRINVSTFLMNNISKEYRQHG